MLVALVVAGFLVGSVLQAVRSLHASVSRWDRSTRMRQALLAGMFRVTADLRMAGCDPWETAGVVGLHEDPGGGPAAQSFRLRMDKRGTSPDSWPDGDAEDPDEQVQYSWNVGEGMLRRSGQPMLSGCEVNPWGVPFFSLEREGMYALARVVLHVSEQADARTLAAAVCVRNPLD